ncbi:MAG: threonylcarbamoyl-AMP synthase [Elusimicrobiaceae bacterium]|nr:threonylcarbamoyl-AMP synthase [Elusimicrobiaceae bacterium]
MKNLTTGKEISFEEICTLLKQGKCIVLPTDTTYGLVCLTTAKNALETLNKTKANPQAKPPQVLCTFKQALQYAVFNEKALKAAETFWPGALTLVLNATELAKTFLPSQTIGLRVPNNDLLLKIMQELDTGLFASSANKHGQGYNPDLEVITKVFAPQGIAIIEGLSLGQASSVIDMTKEEILFIREGQITKANFKKAVS